MRNRGLRTAVSSGKTDRSFIPKNKPEIKSGQNKQKSQFSVTFLFSLIGRPFYYLLLICLVLLFNLVRIISSFRLSPDLLALRKTTIPILVREDISAFIKDLFDFRPPHISVPAPKLPKIPTISFPSHRLGFLFHPLLVFLYLSTASLTFFYYQIIKDLPNPRALASLEPELTTQIFDRNGHLLYKIYANEKRTLVNLDDIPLYLRQATIAIEDKNFYQHQGFSLQGIIRAVERNYEGNKLEGGSTITQQLIKNTLLTHERTITRKIKELILAVHTELIFDKSQILSMYFNQVGFGGPAYGIQEAAQQYFNKNVSQVTLAEAAFLAGLPQAPTRYSPYGANPTLAKQRQIQVLNRMVEDGYITEELADATAREPLHFAPPQIDIKAPHFVMYLKDLLVEKYSEDMVTKGGLQVHTTLDLDLQAQAEKNLLAELDRLQSLKVSNGAMLITKPESGEILAMIGSKNYFDIQNDGQVNLTTSPRQPGSAVKPINYALALEKGYTPASVILDAPITFNVSGSPPWSPKNYDNRFHGNVTLRTALASSYNIPATKLLASNGIPQMVALAQNLGITTWDNPTRYGLSLTLGSNEVKMTDMAEVYGTFANGGVHVPLNPILKITDSEGEEIPFSPCPNSSPTLLKNTVRAASGYKCLPQTVISPQTAYLISDILSDNTARAPAFGLHSVLNIKDHQVAVKTGTSNDLRDNWTIGYTSAYLVATWVGNNDNAPMSRVASGITGASPIWAKTMQGLLAESVSASFSAPQNLVQVPICTLTGTLTCQDCPQTKIETFVKGTEPQKACTSEQIAAITNPSKEIKPTGQLVPQALSTSR